MICYIYKLHHLRYCCYKNSTGALVHLNTVPLTSYIYLGLYTFTSLLISFHSCLSLFIHEKYIYLFIMYLLCIYLLLLFIYLFIYSCFVFLSHPDLFSPSLHPIRANWNLTWPWPRMTLTNLILNVHFIPPATQGSKYEPNQCKFKFYLTFDLGPLAFGAANPLTKVNLHFFEPRCTHSHSFRTIPPFPCILLNF